jgi:hypothetical protein
MEKKMSEFFFDPDQQEGGFKVLPAGEYTAEIIEAEIRPPKSGDGNMLTLT